MISKSQIDIYQKYNGDDDSFSRIATLEEKQEIQSPYWSTIRKLLSDIGIVHNGLASDEFEFKVRQRLKDECDTLETLEYLLNYSKKQKH